MNYKLDEYEQEIESNFEKQLSIKSQDYLGLFQNSAKMHLKKKHPITIRVAEQDIEAIKIKASKLGCKL